MMHTMIKLNGPHLPLGVLVVTTLGSAFLTSAPADALTLSLTGFSSGGTSTVPQTQTTTQTQTINFLSPAGFGTLPTSNNLTPTSPNTVVYTFSNVTLLDPFGNQATFSGRVTAAFGQSLLSTQTGSGLPGAFISVTGLSVQASAGNTSHFQLPSNFLSLTQTFNSPPFATTAATQYYMTGNMFAAANNILPTGTGVTASFNATASNLSLPATLPYSVGISGQTQTAIQVGTTIGSVAQSGTYASPTLNIGLSGLNLAPGALFTSTNTICNAISPNLSFLAAFGSYSACPTIDVTDPSTPTEPEGPGNTVSTPEAPTVIGLLGLGLLGLVAQRKRRIVAH